MRWPKSSNSLALLDCPGWVFSTFISEILTNVMSSAPLPAPQRAFCLQSLPCELREERRKQVWDVSTAAAFPPGKILPGEKELLLTSTVSVSCSELWFGVQHGYNVMTTASSEVRNPALTKTSRNQSYKWKHLGWDISALHQVSMA